jgi:hypothetical protein
VSGGYMAVIGPCFSCRQIFHFNAERVPSIIVNGRREPLCEDCVRRANKLRAENGAQLIVPLPGAYEPEEV